MKHKEFMEKRKKTKKANVPKVLTGDISKLEKALGGDKELILFFLTWLKHTRNATKAYQEMHPGVSYQVAGVLGHRMLKKVNIELILESYGVGVDKYFQQLKDGVDAMVKRAELIERDLKGNPIYEYFNEPDHKTRRAYHEALGKMLGYEGKEGGVGSNVAIQINNIITEKKNTYGI